ncbi:hypothetical protein PDIDSM_3939 [Penicillium digitatum]|nr:hypothetical protein PDIDSM_3939 [Penicillium digitatum]
MGIYQELSRLEAKISDVAAGKIKPVSTIEESLLIHSSSSHNNNRTILQYAIDIVSLGLVPTNVIDILNGITNHEINSIANNNRKDPSPRIHPTRSFWDAPYDIPEKVLRGAIHIPSTFSYGKKQQNPRPPSPRNRRSSRQHLLLQLLSWSQGSLDVQWALKYWPSTRAAVSDFMAVSGDFHGTRLATLCVHVKPFCSPAVQQQGYDTMFIRALRGEGGDSAFVPTTSVYSGSDFIIQPQSGGEASAALGGMRGVGVSNVQVQVACAGRAAGGPYSHSAMLVNPLAYALFVDALVHEGPGRLERIDLDAVCGESLAPGLDVDDVLGMEAVSNVVGVLDVLLYGYDGTQEPPLRGYVHH